ncbi:unnamed protein product [Spodoptera littoralis]|uniref:Uncharacterized protein n=1 Tax=Spodoptera littoralis TaxID=7109 RepID=A0A9P0HYQ1_SPOLI|nr:unnamed protein product [Spodoptera littoralis]CAH1637929.1 unnamed protein product [Spodoptera littoralis]
MDRPPSSSLSYGGAVNDDVRSPGSGGTPGPLSQPPPQTLDATDPVIDSHRNIRLSISINEQRSSFIGRVGSVF